MSDCCRLPFDEVASQRQTFAGCALKNSALGADQEVQHHYGMESQQADAGTVSGAILDRLPLVLCFMLSWRINRIVLTMVQPNGHCRPGSCSVWWPQRSEDPPWRTPPWIRQDKVLESLCLN
eukprot:symbB.v1.2.016830.t3/scaffold1294.1/size126307/5